MSVQFNVDPATIQGFERETMQRFEAARPAALAAMGSRLHELVLANFGIAGVDRPADWAPLSPDYARKVGRQIATLHVSGALKDAVKVGGSEGDSITVSVSDSDVPYATVHQHGGGNNIPARPYFPVDESGEVMPYTAGEVRAAGVAALKEALK